MDRNNDDHYREILWDSLGPTIDALEPVGLAEGGIYQIRRDVDFGCWLVGWIPAEGVFSPPPVGTCVGEGSSFTEVKAIAERDWRRRRRCRHEHRGR
jgi:hypothetical protein